MIDKNQIPQLPPSAKPTTKSQIVVGVDCDLIIHGSLFIILQNLYKTSGNEGQHDCNGLTSGTCHLFASEKYISIMVQEPFQFRLLRNHKNQMITSISKVYMAHLICLLYFLKFLLCLWIPLVDIWMPLFCQLQQRQKSA